MKKITRTIPDYDEYTNSWFSKEVTEYEFATKFYQWLAHRLPRRFIFMCYIEFMAFVTTHGDGVYKTPEEIGFSEATKIWEQYQ